MVFHNHSEEIKERAVYLLHQGWEINYIGHVLGVSPNSIRRWKQNVDEEGTVSPERVNAGILNSETMDALLEHVTEMPNATLDELVEWLAIYHNTEISRSSLKEHLFAFGFKWKKPRWIDCVGEDGERSKWYQNFLQTYSAEQLVFVNESNMNGHTLRVLHRPAVMTPENVRPFPRGVNYNIIPAMDMRGYFALRVQEGSIDPYDFLDFILTDVLSHMAPYPNPRSVLVMEDCASFKSQTLRELVDAVGCHLVFLPPDSPDFSPLEASFSCVKSSTRRNRAHLCNSELPELEFELSCYEAVTEEKCRGWFSDSGYL